MAHLVRIGGRTFAGLILPDSGIVVGKGRTKRTLHTFTIFTPSPQVLDGVEMVKERAKLKERSACEE